MLAPVKDSALNIFELGPMGIGGHHNKLKVVITYGKILYFEIIDIAAMKYYSSENMGL